MPLVMLIGSWFARIIVLKIVAALAVGIVSYGAYSTFIEYLTDQVALSYGGLPTDVLILLNISGVRSALGIVLSALSIRAAFVFASRWMPVSRS